MTKLRTQRRDWEFCDQIDNFMTKWEFNWLILCPEWKIDKIESSLTRFKSLESNWEIYDQKAQRPDWELDDKIENSISR